MYFSWVKPLWLSALHIRKRGREAAGLVSTWILLQRCSEVVPGLLELALGLKQQRKVDPRWKVAGVKGQSFLVVRSIGEKEEEEEEEE